jgi:hypothetical protein
MDVGGEAMSGLGRHSWTIAGSVVAPLLLLISTMWLPWATYRSITLDVGFTSGSLGLVLIVCGAGSLGLVAVSLYWSSTVVYWLRLLLGCGALLVSLAIALAKIADANQTTNARPGYAATTSFGIGAGVAVASSVVMVASSLTLLKSHTVSDSPGRAEARKMSLSAEPAIGGSEGQVSST